MKKIIILLAIAAANGLNAQYNTAEKPSDRKEQRQDLSPDERAKKEADHMAGVLNLNKDQKSKWENAARERIVANKPLKEKMSGSTTPEERAALKKQMRSNREEFKNKIEPMLTAEQKEKLKAEHKNRMEKRGKHKRSHQDEIDE